AAAGGLAQRFQRSWPEFDEFSAGSLALEETVAAELLDQSGDGLQVRLPQRPLAKKLRQGRRVAAQLSVVEHHLILSRRRGIFAARKARPQQAMGGEAAHLGIRVGQQLANPSTMLGPTRAGQHARDGRTSIRRRVRDSFQQQGIDLTTAYT